MKEYIYYRWSNGDKDKNYKSVRKHKLPITDKVNTDTVNTDTVNTDTVNTDTVNTDTVNTDTVNTDTVNTDTVKIESRHSDKKSLCNERISSREMIRRMPINPFLKDGDYIDDLTIQDTLLRPRDSNVENTLQI
jgi:hypothetical protein